MSAPRPARAGRPRLATSQAARPRWLVRPTRPAQGAASLALIMVWLVAASLVVLYANRALIFEQRASANQVRSAQAFEAAEAGIEWALALLSHPGPVDSQCRPTDASGARTLRERLLQVDGATGRVSAGPAQAGCGRAAGGTWQCSCPGSGGPAWPPGDTAATAFSLRVEAGQRAGSFGLVAAGCANATDPCASSPADAHAQVSTVVASLPLLAQPPAAAVMAGGSVELGAGTQVSNDDAASGGVTAAAGGAVTLDAATQLLSLPGRPGTASISADDASLQDVALFTRVLGLAPSTYRDLPAVKRLDCGSACRSRDISAAWAGGRQAVLWVDGGLDLDADLPLGTAEAPLLLVVDGPLRLTGAQEPWGLVMARSVAWQHAGGGIARLRGALLAQGDMALAGGVHVMFDAGVLQRLGRLGSFVRVPGAWHDFER